MTYPLVVLPKPAHEFTPEERAMMVDHYYQEHPEAQDLRQGVTDGHLRDGFKRTQIGPTDV